jgi:hypothetical protein
VKPLRRDGVEERVFGMTRPGHEGRIQALEKSAGVGAGERGYPTFYSIPLFDDFLAYSDVTVDTSLGRIKIDSTVPGNAIRNNYDNYGATRTALDGDHLLFPVRIGPQGSWWGVNIGYKKGPDFGKLKFSWGGPMDEGAGVGGGLESSNDIWDALNGLSWVDYFELVDGYHAATEIVDQLGVLSDFRIMGSTPDDKLTAFTTAVDHSARRHGDGGPGIYYLRVSVDGKNASSSGYKAALWSLTVSTFDDQP